MAVQTKKELLEEIEQLKIKINVQERELKRLKAKEKEMNEIISGIYFAPVKNERNAGRKTLITDELKEEIKEFRNQGMTFREISNKTGLSVGLIHKASQ